MCGRFTLYLTHEEILDLFELIGVEMFQERFNIAPTQHVLTIIEHREPNKREAVMMKWGLIPSWSKDTKLAASLINARGETIAEKPSFRAAFKRRRCIIPASGFYEWKKLDPKHKQPFYISPATENVFRFAGLWEIWKSPAGDEIHSCSIVTTSANSMMQPLHDRMPVILTEENMQLWLDHEIEDRNILENLIQQYDPRLMQCWPVGSDVGSVKNQGKNLITPIEP